MSRERGAGYAGYAGRDGVPQLWLVDPEARRVECHRREGTEYRLVIADGPADTLAHPDFPALAIPLAPLWA